MRVLFYEEIKVGVGCCCERAGFCFLCETTAAVKLATTDLVPKQPHLGTSPHKHFGPKILSFETMSSRCNLICLVRPGLEKPFPMVAKKSRPKMLTRSEP